VTDNDFGCGRQRASRSASPSFLRICVSSGVSTLDSARSNGSGQNGRETVLSLDFSCSIYSRRRHCSSTKTQTHLLDPASERGYPIKRDTRRGRPAQIEPARHAMLKMAKRLPQPAD
jgi:hypothetical protein